MTRQLTDSNTSCTSLFDVYLAIFIQFFCDFHTVFSASHKSKRTSCIYIFQRLIHIFKDDFTKFQDNSRTKGTFFQDQGQIFPGLCEPCKSMSHIICHINPKIQFVDICCGHGMSLTVFIHCDLDLRSQFLKKMHPQQIAYFIYGSIPYLVCRYIFDPGESPNVSRSL